MSSEYKTTRHRRMLFNATPTLHVKSLIRELLLLGMRPLDACSGAFHIDQDLLNEFCVPPNALVRFACKADGLAVTFVTLSHGTSALYTLPTFPHELVGSEQLAFLLNLLVVEERANEVRQAGAARRKLLHDDRHGLLTRAEEELRTDASPTCKAGLADLTRTGNIPADTSG